MPAFLLSYFSFRRSTAWMAVSSSDSNAAASWRISTDCPMVNSTDSTTDSCFFRFSTLIHFPPQWYSPTHTGNGTVRFFTVPRSKCANLLSSCDIDSNILFFAFRLKRFYAHVVKEMFLGQMDLPHLHEL